MCGEGSGPALGREGGQSRGSARGGGRSSRGSGSSCPSVRTWRQVFARYAVVIPIKPIGVGRVLNVNSLRVFLVSEVFAVVAVCLRVGRGGPVRSLLPGQPQGEAAGEHEADN